MLLLVFILLDVVEIVVDWALRIGVGEVEEKTGLLTLDLVEDDCHVLLVLEVF